MFIDLDAIKSELFRSKVIRSRILRDFGINSTPENSESLAQEVLKQLGQSPVSNPLDQAISNRHVFRAAVRALGSNSRTWATYLKNESRIAELTGNFDPINTYEAFEKQATRGDALKALLPGQSSSSDARAIQEWARLLTAEEDYYATIHDLGMAFRRLGEDKHHERLADSDLMLCLVGYLAAPPTSWPGGRYLPSSRRGANQQQKLPGMGYILASEFFRNLGWNGFKPDRHIQRLFLRWLPAQNAQVEKSAERLRMLIGRRTATLNTYLRFSLKGTLATPPGTPLSRVDNLVWLLGAYVEKKGRESSIKYLME